MRFEGGLKQIKKARGQVQQQTGLLGEVVLDPSSSSIVRRRDPKARKHRQLIILVVGKIKGARKPPQARLVRFDGTHEEAARFGGIARSPFLPGFLEVNTDCRQVSSQSMGTDPPEWLHKRADVTSYLREIRLPFLGPMVYS